MGGFGGRYGTGSNPVRRLKSSVAQSGRALPRE